MSRTLVTVSAILVFTLFINIWVHSSPEFDQKLFDIAEENTLVTSLAYLIPSLLFLLFGVFLYYYEKDYSSFTSYFVSSVLILLFFILNNPYWLITKNVKEESNKKSMVSFVTVLSITLVNIVLALTVNQPNTGANVYLLVSSFLLIGYQLFVLLRDETVFLFKVDNRGMSFKLVQFVSIAVGLIPLIFSIVKLMNRQAVPSGYESIPSMSPSVSATDVPKPKPFVPQKAKVPVPQKAKPPSTKPNLGKKETSDGRKMPKGAKGKFMNPATGEYQNKTNVKRKLNFTNV